MKKLVISLMFIFVISSQLVEAQEFSITPNMINETTTIEKIFDKTLDLKNTGDSDIYITAVEISGDIKNIVSVVERPSIIPPNTIKTVKIKIDTTNSVEGSYSGVISVLFNGNSSPIHVSLNVISSAGPTIDIQGLSNFFETIFPMEDIENHSYIVWYFAIGVIILIIIITILKYRKRKKKKKEEKKERKEEKEEAEEIYYKPQKEYRTEYY